MNAAPRLILALLLLWLAIAATAWSLRNPLGNEATFWSHFKDVMSFQKLEKFQPLEP